MILFVYGLFGFVYAIITTKCMLGLANAPPNDKGANTTPMTPLLHVTTNYIRPFYLG